MVFQKQYISEIRFSNWRFLAAIGVAMDHPDTPPQRNPPGHGHGTILVHDTFLLF